jgi:hypothetical protein
MMASADPPRTKRPTASEFTHFLKKITKLDSGRWDASIYAHVVLVNDYRDLDQREYWWDAVSERELCTKIMDSCVQDYKEADELETEQRECYEMPNNWKEYSFNYFIINELSTAVRIRWTALLEPQGLEGYPLISAALKEKKSRRHLEEDDALLDERENFLVNHIRSGSPEPILVARFLRNRDGISFGELEIDMSKLTELDLGTGMYR